MLLTPCGVDFVNTLLYHLKPLQLSFFPFFLFSPTLSEGYNTVMRGTLQQQTIDLENGATTIINHFYVTSIEVLSRSKRTSMTVYEKEKTR